jgi:hypothetical protein
VNNVYMEIMEEEYELRNMEHRQHAAHEKSMTSVASVPETTVVIRTPI